VKIGLKLPEYYKSIFKKWWFKTFLLPLLVKSFYLIIPSLIQKSYFYGQSHYIIISIPMKNSLNCNGKLISLSSPIVMGIINVNNDSFYASSRAKDINAITEKVAQMLMEGVSIIDIGAMSSKPGSPISNPNEEAKTIASVVKSLLQNFPDLVISIDSLHSEVAKAAVDSGASIINDISAGDFDEQMIPTIAQLKVPYIMMHKKGMPVDMQLAPYYDDVVMDVVTYFVHKIKQVKEAGIQDIVIDPGFGFGKTLDHNYTLLKSLEVFQIFDAPILVGISRKSMIYKYLETDVEQALNGTTALNMVALQKGAKILRVHDVKEAVECIKLFSKIENA
jgi:dihydropteroate synthase